MDLEIKYEHGSMVIHLEKFLDCRNISKVRKLVKIIRSSFTPECEEQIKEYVQQEIEQFEQNQKENAKYIIGYTEKVKFCQKQLDNCIYNRERYKQNSEGWKHYNDFVKQYRQELKELKTLLRSRQTVFDKNIKNKEFYRKVLEIIT
jgi:hypothetical protein|nr:MAG TPA: hypothetical protein [Caudoviricetes sp.]